MKMKVKVVDLRKAIEAHVAADEKRFEKETQEYAAAIRTATLKQLSNIRDYVREVVHKGKPAIHESYEMDRRFNRGVKWPKAPHKPQHYDAILTKLSLSVDPTITVDDDSEYMRLLSDKCICR